MRRARKAEGPLRVGRLLEALGKGGGRGGGEGRKVVMCEVTRPEQDNAAHWWRAYYGTHNGLK